MHIELIYINPLAKKIKFEINKLSRKTSSEITFKSHSIKHLNTRNVSVHQSSDPMVHPNA